MNSGCVCVFDMVVFYRSSAAFKTFEDKMENLKVGSFVCCVLGWLL